MVCKPPPTLRSGRRPEASWLNDIVNATNELISITPATREDYDSDAMLRCCVERRIAEIGEAATQLNNQYHYQDEKRWPEIEWGDIIRMRANGHAGAVLWEGQGHAEDCGLVSEGRRR